jgi:hypothetical protein
MNRRLRPIRALRVELPFKRFDEGAIAKGAARRHRAARICTADRGNGGSAAT